MWHGFLPNVKFFLMLVEFDEEIARKTRATGCPCGGKLHRADYPRKPRGMLPEAERAFSRRISFCCEREGCRARTTPLSIRFISRTVYVFAIVMVATATYCRQRALGGARRAATTTARAFDVPRRTLRRWSTFFETILPALSGFIRERSRFMPPLDETLLPLSLLERFLGGPPDQLVAALRFVAAATSPPARRARYPTGAC
ncbi:MAG TPA: hypothetical protein PKA58_16420 [Polyangium sp.]|nr:hypothetical protein [Polyangium sp.]